MKFALQGLKQQLIDGLKALFNLELEHDQIQLKITPKHQVGDYTWLTFAPAKKIGLAPQEVAKRIGRWMEHQGGVIDQFEVVGGFLNIILSTAGWQQLWEQLQDASHRVPIGKEQKILIEIAAPNTNKPLHIGHLRNTFLGDAVANLLEAKGHRVIRVQHINDRGIHICKSMLAYQRLGKSETPESTGRKGDHFVGAYYVAFNRLYQEEKIKYGEQAPIIAEAQEMLRRWEQGDEVVRTLWNTMNRWVYDGFETTYKRLGITFDRCYYESDTYLLGKQIVEQGVERGLFIQREDHSIWADLTAHGLDQKLLLRGDGTAVYITQDIGTAFLREQEEHADRYIYVVGNEQDYHFSVLFALLDQLGSGSADKLYHLSYGMVDLPNGKMKSREGNVVDADDLMEEVVASLARKRAERSHEDREPFAEVREPLDEMMMQGALKYFLLRINPQKRILFDPQVAIDFQGDTGTFIQYTHARIQTMLYKYPLGQQGRKLMKLPTLEAVEKRLLTLLVSYHNVVDEAATQLDPSLLAQHLHQLAKAYNSCYAHLPIAKEKNSTLRRWRYLLSKATQIQLKEGAKILGFDLPMQM